MNALASVILLGVTVALVGAWAVGRVWSVAGEKRRA